MLMTVGKREFRNDALFHVWKLGTKQNDWFSRKAVYITDTFIYNLFDNRVR